MNPFDMNLQAALAGFAYALGNVWPLVGHGFDRDILAAAERLAVGRPVAAADAPRGLRSVFSRLNGWRGEDRYVPFRPLSLAAEALYPIPLAELSGSAAEMIGQFQDAVAARGPAEISQARLETLLDLAQRYLWCVPAPQYGAESDVSLYDHARIVAALAVCLAAGGDAAGQVALLVGGDLSGVQDWLYTLSSGGAAKMLRGRSFYLQLLTEIIAWRMLDGLDLPLTNLVYAGGGNFYLLAPAAAASQVEQLGRAIGEAILASHGGDLYVAVGSTPVAADEFAEGRIGTAWARVTEATGIQKQRRYTNLGAEVLGREIGAALTQGGAPDKVCSICERENPTGDAWSKTQDGAPKCGLCLSLEELGQQLPDASHIAAGRLAQPAPADQHINHWQEGVAALGYAVSVIDAAVVPPQDTSGVQFVRIGRTTPAPDAQADRQAAYAFRGVPAAISYRPLINVVPRVNGHIATFDEFCKQALGIPRWGVLRMDVDNLGRLFQGGFGERAVLSRTAGLSFALRLFFEGRLSEVARPCNTDRAAVYAMYSGGDDLFIVGAWDALPHLAHDIRAAFRQFVAGNPTITLSGGISLAPERFPIYQAARQAGDAEAAAKDFVRVPKDDQPAEKDALTFLGQAFGWEQFEAIWGRVQQLQTWSDNRTINRSLIQTLRAIDNEYLAGLDRQRRLRARGKPGQAGQFYYGPWMWKLVYQLSRVAQEARSAEVAGWVKQLRDELVEPDGPITFLGLIARWAEYLTRRSDE